jgi:hypothetical protein
MTEKRNWYLEFPLQRCEIHNKPYMYLCYKCMKSVLGWKFCASELDCKTCRDNYRLILPFPYDVSELIIRYIAPKLSNYHGNCGCNS